MRRIESKEAYQVVMHEFYAKEVSSKSVVNESEDVGGRE